MYFADPFEKCFLEQEGLVVEEFDFTCFLEPVQYPRRCFAGYGSIAGDELVLDPQIDDDTAGVPDAIELMKAVENDHDPVFGTVEAQQLHHHPCISEPQAEEIDNLLPNPFMGHEVMLEVVSVQQADERFFVGYDGCRLGLAVEKGHFAEKVSLLVDGYDLFPPVIVQLHHPYFPGINQVHVGGSVLFGEHDLVFLKASLDQDPVNALRFVRGKIGEKGYVADDVLSAGLRFVFFPNHGCTPPKKAFGSRCDAHYIMHNPFH